MGPFERAMGFGKITKSVTEQDPGKAEQMPETQNDVLAAKRTWELDPTDVNGRAYINALRRCGHHQEADEFALKHHKVKPKFTITEGF